MFNTQKQLFLENMQRCIERYTPLLEREFEVNLGAVGTRELRVGRFLKEELNETVIPDMRRRFRERKGRVPKSYEELIIIAQAAVTRRAMWLPLWVRLWWPDIRLRWNDRLSTVEISFVGWWPGDYNKNMAKIDQFIVHELAHGIWDRIVGVDDHRDRDDWRLWNEGFAHYLADVHFRHLYPSSAEVYEDWPPFRERAKNLVAQTVNSRGINVLKSIPMEWPEIAKEHNA